jgi:hypothetical protein
MIAVWWEKPLLFFVLVVAIGLLGTALARLLARRSIANWAGSGVHRDLAPDEAALLFRWHPSGIVVFRFLLLELEGKARLLSDRPFRVEWTGGTPQTSVEEAFAAALDEAGGFREEGVFALLEAIYERVNSEMAVYSGRATAVHYRELAREILEEFLEGGAASVAVVPWLVLSDPDEVWDAIGDDPVGRALKRAYRLANLAEQWLVPLDSYIARVKAAKQGFFRYRKDLRKLGRCVAGASSPTWWVSSAQR